MCTAAQRELPDWYGGATERGKCLVLPLCQNDDFSARTSAMDEDCGFGCSQQKRFNPKDAECAMFPIPPPLNILAFRSALCVLSEHKLN